MSTSINATITEEQNNEVFSGAYVHMSVSVYACGCMCACMFCTWLSLCSCEIINRANTYTRLPSLVGYLSTDKTSGTITTGPPFSKEAPLMRLS